MKVILSITSDNFKVILAFMVNFIKNIQKAEFYVNKMINSKRFDVI